MTKVISKILNIGNILFLLCTGLLIAMKVISLGEYFVLLIVAYAFLVLANEEARNAIMIRLFMREGCFSQSNEHYGVIYSKTIKQDIARIMPKDFPYFIRDLYIKKGYKARVVNEDIDNYGIDVIAQKDDEILAIRTVFLKNKGETVGNAEIQKVVAGMRLYAATKAIVITNKPREKNKDGVMEECFSKAAVEQGQPNGVKLIEGNGLQALVRDVIYRQQRQCYEKEKRLGGLIARCTCFNAGNKQYGILKEDNLVKDIERIKPLDFEALIRDLFVEIGYQARLTKLQDRGGDVIAKRKKESIVIQVKHSENSETQINEDGVAEAVAAMGVYKTKQCAVVTNAQFSEKALKLAAATNVIMIDGHKLRELIKKYLLS